LVDLNRSPGSRTLFSELTRPLPHSEQQEILRLYHRPYWRAAEDMVTGIIASGRQALHLSVHSFTPVLNGRKRNADIGLLYDPQRPAEKTFCLAWQNSLTLIAPTLRVRRNYPYRGNADALVTALRSRFPAESYLGIELEINQQNPLEGGHAWRLLQKQMLLALRPLLTSIPPRH
jgi:predicted N-formylglutamate amidohydrolase